ncbi:MAG: PKD domain-containing protein [Saprospiraceae bacterium]
MRTIYSLCIGLLSLSTLFSQEALSGVINHYSTVQTIDLCTNTLEVGQTTGFSEGMDILLIQMQGAQINRNNNSSFGNITSLGGAGLYEKNQIAAINGNRITLAFQIKNDYDPTGRVQMVSFPRFEDAVVVEIVTGQAWDGSRGGIIAFQVEDTLVLEAPIVANGLGFRGGLSVNTDDNNCNALTNANNYFYGSDNWRGAPKGEGIALPKSGEENGRGPQANGGGGGNDHNAGGGGGANVTKAGQGGTNNEPSFFGCDGNFPGFGGKALAADTSRLFLGGGGGAGHENNLVGTNGGIGGGIIIISVGQLVANTFSLQADGNSPPDGGGDGAGGGGGGGTILLLSSQQPSSLSATARGGNGGNINNNNLDRCHGPGGGGSGGHVLTNLTLPLAGVQIGGGAAGLTFNSSSCADGTNGSEPGSPGQISPVQASIAANEPFSSTAIIDQANTLTVCINQPLLLPVTVQGTSLTLQWSANQGNGFVPIQDGPLFQGVTTDTLRISQVGLEMASWQFQLLVTNPCGANITSDPISLNLLPVPTAGFTANQNGQNVQFNNTSQNALSYAWDFGDGENSTAISPTHVYGQAGTYVVTLSAYNDCDTVQTTTVITIAGVLQALFSASPQVGCAPLSVDFANESLGEISSIVWLFPGGSPSFSSDNQPSISYTQAGLYDVTLIVTNALGVDSLTLKDYIEVRSLPVSAFNFTLNGLDVTVNNAAINADQIAWYVPALDVTSTAPTATFTFMEGGTYTIQLTASNACGSVSSEQSITLGQAPNANFSFTPTGGCERATIQFSNQSSGSIDNYAWAFPGGTPESSTLQNPIVTYENAGLYTVSLQVGGPLGEANLVREGAVEVLLRPNPSFSFTIDGLSVSFQNNSSEANRYNWSFGDGNNSNEGNPTHIYTAPGLYDVSLNAQNQYCGLAISQSVFLKPNATDEPAPTASWVAYPNPFTNELFLLDKSGMIGDHIHFQLYNDLGQLKQQGTFVQQLSLSTTTLSAGIYWIKMSQEGKVVWRKIVKLNGY